MVSERVFENEMQIPVCHTANISAGTHTWQVPVYRYKYRGRIDWCTVRSMLCYRVHSRWHDERNVTSRCRCDVTGRSRDHQRRTAAHIEPWSVCCQQCWCICSVLQPSSIRGLATPWTYFLHLSLSSIFLTDLPTGSPVHYLVLSIQAVRRLPRLQL